VRRQNESRTGRQAWAIALPVAGWTAEQPPLPNELAVTDSIVMTDRDELYASPAVEFFRLPDQRRLTVGSEFAYGLADRLQSEPQRPPGMSLAQFVLFESFNSAWVAHGVDIFDRSNAQFGVEERHPFHDRRVYEFLLAIQLEDLLR